MQSKAVDGFINVHTLGIVGDNKTDNRVAIEKAFNKGGNYYFPKGTYLINSYSYVYNIVLIAQNKNGLRLKFADGAVIKAGNNLISEKDKGCLLCFVSKEANVPFIEIENLQIDGNRSKNKGRISGVLFYEQPQFFIKKVVINKANISNLSGSGIHTEAQNTFLNNILTTNCGSHGIGINQTYNSKIRHYVEINDYISINDGAYSIDFSGPYDPNDVIRALPDFKFRGKATNILSINSAYGIKTAGYWDLEMNNVRIINSGGNGFFINKDAPGTTIKICDMTISKARDNGLSLGHKASFIGKNIVIDSCTVPIMISECSVDLDSLIIRNDERNLACISIDGENSQKVTINNFQIRNSNKDNIYLIVNHGSDLELKNGIIENNRGPYFLYLGNNVKNSQIVNLQFKNNGFYNIITPDGAKKNIRISNISGFESQKIFRKIENRIQDNITQE